MKETKINDLIPDDKNFNEGTQYGQHLIEESLRKFGAGRSVLIDKNNRIIAGNKTIENAAAIGLEDVIVVETTGDKIVAVKRTDVDLDSKEGREMALADNATGMANLSWDMAALEEAEKEFGIAPNDWGVKVKPVEDIKFEEEFDKLDNNNAVYPLIPKYDEKHELFIIESSSEVDSNYLREILNMQRMKSYKTGTIGKSNVINIKDVINAIENRNSEP